MPTKKKTKTSVTSFNPTILGAVAVVISVATAISVWLWRDHEKSEAPDVVVVPLDGGFPGGGFPGGGYPGGIQLTQLVKGDLYPEPIARRYGSLPSVRTRMQRSGPIQQVGILTGEGGSSTSAAPDRTILPLYGRELDPRRSKWTYYTRTDGANPIQVPVRVGNRTCDDERNGCNEVYSNDDVHVPALGRAFKATIYRNN
jgi:hypothetical protein